MSPTRVSPGTHLEGNLQAAAAHPKRHRVHVHMRRIHRVSTTISLSCRGRRCFNTAVKLDACAVWPFHFHRVFLVHAFEPSPGLRCCSPVSGAGRAWVSDWCGTWGKEENGRGRSVEDYEN